MAREEREGALGAASATEAAKNDKAAEKSMPVKEKRRRKSGGQTKKKKENKHRAKVHLSSQLSGQTCSMDVPVLFRMATLCVERR